MRARLALASLVLTLAACTVPVAEAPRPETTVKRTALQPTKPTSLIEGAVRAPAGIIAAGGGNLIGHSGGNIIGHDSGSYALLAVEEAPIAGVEVFVADAAGKRIPSIASVKTDAQGRYRLPQVPAGYTFLVVARVETAAGDEALLKTLTRSSEVGATADLDTATTLVSVAALEGASELGELNLATFQRAVATTGKHLDAATLPDLADQDAVAAFMRELSEEVAALKETVAQLKKDMAQVLQRLDELENRQQSPAPTATPAATPTPGATAVPTATPTPADADPPGAVAGWTVSTLAGSGAPDFADGQGAAASFKLPRGLALGPAGAVYVADSGNNRIRQIDAQGNVTTIAGTGAPGKTSTPTEALAAVFSNPWDVVRDASGRLFVSEAGNGTLTLIAGGQVSIFASNGGGTLGDGTGTAARFYAPRCLALTSGGDLVVADSATTSTTNGAARFVTLAAVVSTLMDSGRVAPVVLPSLRDVAVDAAGNVYGVQEARHRVVKIAPGGVMTTIAGEDGVAGAEDGTGTAARFSSPTGIARDDEGNLYVADYENHRLRKIAPDGVVTTIAGTSEGHDDGPSTTAKLKHPYDVEVDENGKIYVLEHRGHRVRVITRQ
ncbi:MAG: hypothetical protein ACLGIN_15705 [Candidatus Sericytochromatia bacterium]